MATKRVKIAPDDILDLKDMMTEIRSFFTNDEMADICLDVMSFCSWSLESTKVIGEGTETSEDFIKSLSHTICLNFLRLYIDQKKFFTLMKNLEPKYRDTVLHVTEDCSNQD